MAHITEIGPHLYVQRLYWQTESPPLVHRSRTTETEPPFRVGTCLVLRVPFTKLAFALGLWVGVSSDEEDALLSSMGARVTRDNGIRLTGEVDW